MRSKYKPRWARWIHVAIATTMLGVPASALALSGVTDTQAASSAALHATVSPRHARLGQSVTVRGTAPASATGHRAVLEFAVGPRRSWRGLATTRIAPGGHFAFTTHLRHSGYLRVIDSGPIAQASGIQTSRSAVPIGGASAAQPVAIAARFAIAGRRIDALAGHRVTLRGTLNPARGGRIVRVQARLGRGWRTLSTTRTGASGRFRARFAPVSGLGRLRVDFGGDRANAATSGAAGLVTVFNPDVASWYDDAGNTGCGFHATYGVANRSLPCGTKVRIRFGGRSVTATVDDRGPYVGGRNWDLNQNTAAALQFGGVGTIWISQ